MISAFRYPRPAQFPPACGWPRDLLLTKSSQALDTWLDCVGSELPSTSGLLSLSARRLMGKATRATSGSLSPTALRGLKFCHSPGSAPCPVQPGGESPALDNLIAACLHGPFSSTCSACHPCKHSHRGTAQRPSPEADVTTLFTFQSSESQARQTSELSGTQCRR